MSEFLRVADLVVRLELHPNTVRRWWHEGILPEPVGPSALMPRWRAADIDRWVAGGCKPAQLKAYGMRRRKTRAKKGDAK